MKVTVCLLLLALGCALAQKVPSARNVTAPAVNTSKVEADASPVIEASPLPELEASPLPLVEESPLPVVEDSPLPAVEGVPSPEPTEVIAEEPVASPTADTTASPAPDAAATLPVAPVANTTANATAANITDNRVQAYYSSPLFAIQQTPELSGLAGLAKDSRAARVLSNRTFIGTIFAPNNDAVDAAVAFVTNATGLNATELADAGVVDQLLAYHVTGGAALLRSRLTNGQTLTMLDGNKTEITIEDAAGARRLLQETTFFINSDSNQQAKIVDGNIQGGKAMIHIIDAVLVPEALLTAFNISPEGLPGVVPGDTGVAAADAAASREVTPTSAQPAKSSASKTAAAFLAVPALLAALMF